MTTGLPERGDPPADIDGPSVRGPGYSDFRSEIHASELMTALDASVAPSTPGPAGFEPVHQIVLTYAGATHYSVGRRTWLLDYNRAMFISPGWEFADTHVAADIGHASLLINPKRHLLEELCTGRGISGSRAFREGSLRTSGELMLMAQLFKNRAAQVDNPLGKDESVIELMRVALGGDSASRRPSTRTVDRAKEFLHERGFDRLSLSDIAQAVGVTPTYLTQEFSRSEGMPLYQYQLALRLNRAMIELPHCDNITALALDLGFSSHSHFSTAFKHAFGLTPSQFRRSTQADRALSAEPWSASRQGVAIRRAA